jgi:SIR2-like domain
MQYGLPSFLRLLRYLAAELRLGFSPHAKISEIRPMIEERWLLGTTPDSRRSMISKFLGGVSGAQCTAYRQIARLAAKGHIKAFVNMNFDLLLEEALAAENVQFRTTNAFTRIRPGELIVYKLHGSIGPLDIVKGDEDVTLDLAKSDLFTEQQRAAARTLLAAYDVLLIGYSGADLKVPEALMPKHRRGNKKVFIVNVDDPDLHLLHAVEQRDPGYILTTGRPANFENFLEQLMQEMDSPDTLSEDEPGPDPVLTRVSEFNLMTRAEETAFDYCIKAAVSIRAGMNIAEKSPIGLLDHAQEVFQICTELAAAAGVRLTSPEKLILRYASVLHDLGYLFAFCGGRATENPGWLLLNRHGRMTADLIQERFAEDPSLMSSLIPTSYEKKLGAEILEHLLGVCKFHAALQIPRHPVATESLVIEINSIPSMSRFHLIRALFAAAENIAREHPFLPSSEPVTSGQRWAIEDPVLDLYLLRKRGVANFTIRRAEVRAEVSSETQDSRATTWLLAMTSEFVKAFDRIVTAGNHGWGITFKVPRNIKLPPVKGSPGNFLKSLLGGALEEALEASTQTIPTGAVDEVPSLLDLLMIYGKCSFRAEPRVHLNSRVVTKTLNRVGSREATPHRGVLHLYHEIQRKANFTPMEEVFLETFEHLLYPGWRFLARNWNDGIEATLTARACLDLGASRFRDEVIGGLKHLLREKLTWSGQEAFGHDGCTLCTARLLYIFTCARQLFPPSEFDRIARNRRGGLNDAIRGMLNHFRFRHPDDPAWSGVSAEEGKEERIDSPDYASWAAWALAYCLEVDREIKVRTDEEWLSGTCGFQLEEVRRLAGERWERLLAVTAKKLLSDRVEEPHSFTIGQFASSFLNLKVLAPKDRAFLIPPGAKLHRLAEEVDAAYNRLTKRPLAQLSMFYLWPATMFLDNVFPSTQRETSLVRTCYECLRSPIWIKRGPDAGSWGFNVKNTSIVLTTLSLFWRYVFEGNDGQNRERFDQVFARYTTNKKPRTDTRRN